jgi:hypothetical protein
MVGTKKAAIKLARLDWNSVSLEAAPLARSTDLF